MPRGCCPTLQAAGQRSREAARHGHAAVSAGHELRWIRVAHLDFPLIRTREDWEKKEPPAVVREAQETILWAQHLVILYPLWMGDMPALLKAFFEQVARPGFAFASWMATGTSARRAAR